MINILFEKQKAENYSRDSFVTDGKKKLGKTIYFKGDWVKNIKSGSSKIKLIFIYKSGLYKCVSNMLALNYLFLIE